MSKGKILFQLSGSIACFKACALLSRLVQEGFEVEVVASRAALAFVGEATLEGLAGRKVHIETFASGEHMNHIRLIRWADLAILCPATANVICKMASGIADDLIGTVFLAHDFNKPYLVVPAMNVSMMAHPATRSALAKLSEWGVNILGTSSGALACGEIGEGRMLEPEAIFTRIVSALSERRAAGAVGIADTHGTAAVAGSPGITNMTSRSATHKARLRILITSGGTREPIDGVRSITNLSSGRTGACIAEYLHDRGHNITYLGARSSVKPKTSDQNSRTLEFVTFQDLATVMDQELRDHEYDAVIHCAAVSDFSVASIDDGGGSRTLRPAAGAETKIETDGDLTLRLRKNPKLVDGIKSRSRNPAVRVVAFKLTHTPDETARRLAVRKLAEHARPDLIVLNDANEIDAAGDRHLARVLSGDGTRELACAKNKLELARALESVLCELFFPPERSAIQ